MLVYRVREHKKKRHPRNKNYIQQYTTKKKIITVPGMYVIVYYIHTYIQYLPGTIFH